MSVPLSLLLIFVVIQDVVFAVVIYLLYRLNNKNMSFIMSSMDNVAYRSTQKQSPVIPSPEELGEKQKRRDYKEYTGIYSSGLVNDEQEEKFGGKEPIIQ